MRSLNVQLLLYCLLVCRSFVSVVTLSEAVCSADDEATASTYLLQQQQVESKAGSGTYHLHGWRWHSMSVLRELRLLETFIKVDETEPHQPVPTRACVSDLVQHIIGFNMKGLHKVESNLFFPWLKIRFDRILDATSRTAFQRILVTVVQYQQQLIQQGQLMIDTLSEPESQDQLDLDTLTPLVTSMVSTLLEISRLQTQFLVPAVSILVPAPEQTSLNYQILKSMGLWDSRLYLVGMSEAVHESSSNDTEWELFQREIPVLVRSLIPRWKRLLYDPQTSCLSHLLSQ